MQTLPFIILFTPEFDGNIRGDFLCVGSDLLCQYSFGELADLHRSRASDLTMLLVSAPTEEAEKKGEKQRCCEMQSGERIRLHCRGWIDVHKSNELLPDCYNCHNLLHLIEMSSTQSIVMLFDCL